MRTAVLGERLLGLPVDGAVEVAAALVQSLRPGDMESTMAIHALSDFLGGPQTFSYELRSDWYRVARSRGFEQLCRMLLPRSPLREMPVVRDSGDQVLKGRDNEPLSLGERKSLARGRNRGLLERLLVDPDPMVIRNLLRNPTLTEEWVLRIATRRPIREAVLVEISQNQRWCRRYRVRVALARNPYTAVDLAVRMVPEIQTPDLLEMSRDGTLHPVVREAASEELALRRGLVR